LCFVGTDRFSFDGRHRVGFGFGHLCGY
jgi:hypothetical protein